MQVASLAEVVKAIGERGFSSESLIEATQILAKKTLRRNRKTMEKHPKAMENQAKTGPKNP